MVCDIAQHHRETSFSLLKYLDSVRLFVLSRCVIAELFTEGGVAFDLSQLLAYRSGEFNPGKLLQKIEDPHIKVHPSFSCIVSLMTGLLLIILGFLSGPCQRHDQKRSQPEEDNRGVSAPAEGESFPRELLHLLEALSAAFCLQSHHVC